MPTLNHLNASGNYLNIAILNPMNDNKKGCGMLPQPFGVSNVNPCY